MNIPKKHLAIAGIVWLACAVLFFLADVLMLAPRRKQRAQVEKQLQQTKQAHRSALLAAQEETQIVARAQLDQLRDGLGRFVIGSEDPGNLIFDISQLAKEKKVGSFSIRNKEQPGKTEESEFSKISENRIAISFTCSFDQFATFLNALERHRPVVFIDQFRFKRAKPNDKGHKVEMELAVFVRKQQES